MGVGAGFVTGADPGSGPRPLTRTPLNPPPPYCTALRFHEVGRLTWKLIAGAAESWPLTWPRTRQNSGRPVAASAGVRAALSTTAPLVGRSIFDALICSPESCAHRTLACLTVAGLGDGCPSAAGAAATPTQSAAIAVAMKR